MRGSQHPPLIRGDFSLHLLTQIEMLRGDISHEELSKRLGDVTERYLARYVAGKVHLLERDFYQLAKALGISAFKNLVRFDTLQAYYSIAGRDL